MRKLKAFTWGYWGWGQSGNRTFERGLSVPVELDLGRMDERTLFSNLRSTRASAARPAGSTSMQTAARLSLRLYSPAASAASHSAEVLIINIANARARTGGVTKRTTAPRLFRWCRT